MPLFNTERRVDCGTWAVQAPSAPLLARDREEVNDTPQRSIWGPIFVGASVLCMAPTVLALIVGSLTVCVGLLMASAPENNPYVVFLISIVFSVLAAYVLAAMGLLLHTLGIGVSFGAFRTGHRWVGAGLGGLHGLMLLIDVLFWVSVLVLFVTAP